MVNRARFCHLDNGPTTRLSRKSIAGSGLPGASCTMTKSAVHGLMPTSTRGNPVQGFYLLTPLEIAPGARVFVNRGFVTNLHA